jgi:superfamily I DNA and/or RNA helicase
VDGWASGLAVRFVEHAQPSMAASPDEAAAVAELWHSLQGTGWVDAAGERSVIGPDDVLVVAPYNNQVALIRRALPDGVRVGTVDKFQGQEAPVVVYSMTSTSAEDAPRGVSFLYDLHRLNVAVSRAKALAVVVVSEELLDAAVRTPEQLRQVNALCRLVEMATVVS